MKYEEALQTLYQRNEFSVKLGLENIKTLLNLLGNPHRKIPTIHIAGTNGKGSVSYFLAEIFRIAGFKVGLYTSPHLVDFRERIQINKKMISKRSVARGLEKIEKMIRQEKKKDPTFSATYFEVATALAWDYFHEKKVDITVLETGLGGRLDSTNICVPLVSVITSIGIDHTDILGKSLAAIAKEKAGIIKEGIPVVVGETRKPRLSLLRQEAKRKKAPFVLIPSYRRLKKRDTQECFDYESSFFKLPNITLSMLGKHQIQNAVTAIATLEQLRETSFEVSDAAIRKGLAQSQWPGRFQILNKEPLLIVDGAHNVEGILSLRQTLNEKKILNPIFIFGLNTDKQKESIIRKLFRLSDSFYLVSSLALKATAVPTLKNLFQNAGYSGNLNLSYTIATALPAALAQGKREKRAVCVCGSLYLIGETFSHLKKEYAKN